MTHHTLALVSVSALTLLAAASAQEAKPDKLRGYVGTYTSSRSKGIYYFELDLATGAVTPKGLATEAVNPSFLAVHPNRKFLYAVGSGAKEIAAFKIGPKGMLTELPAEMSPMRLSKGQNITGLAAD